MKRDRERKLADIGSTTALSAMVEIVETGAGANGVLARQARAMLARLKSPDHGPAIEGFCDELQTFIESVPGAKEQTPERLARRAGR